MIDHSLDMILTIVVLSFWFLFPIGIFLSVAHVDKNTDQIVRLDKLRHASAESVPEVKDAKTDIRKKRPGDFNRRRPAHA